MNTVKNIGPSFAAEIQAAGLAGLPFAWAADGSFSFSDEMTPAQRDAVLAVYEAHEPQAAGHAVPRTCTPLEFIERFTEAEQLAVVTAAMQVPALRLWYDKLMAAQQVVEGDPRLIAGLQALVDAGLITAKRRDEVLVWS